MRRTRIYEGRVLGLSVYEGTIEGRRVRREMIEHRGAAAVLAVDSQDRVILVRQHRFPHGYVLEVPAGTLEEGEEPEACAFREFEEETGYAASGMAHLITYYPSIGYNSEAIHCFVASGISKSRGQRLDDDEILSVRRVGLGRLLGMIRSGKVQDSKTICAVLTYASKKGIP